MTILTAQMRMALDASGFVKTAGEVAAALDRDVKRIDALKTALRETGASDRLQASMMRLGAAEPQIDGMRRALERFKAEQGLVGVAAADMTAEQRKAMRTFESVTVSTMRRAIAEEKKHAATAIEATHREEEARVEAVRHAAEEALSIERRLSAQIAEQDARAENRRIAVLAAEVAGRTKAERRDAAVREAIEAEVTSKVRAEARLRVAASQEEAVAIERIARHETELRVRAIAQETAAIVAARQKQAESEAEAAHHARARMGLGHYAMQGAAAAVSAHGVVHAGERVLEAGAERQDERINMGNAGIPASEIVRIEDEALRLSTLVGNVSQTKVMEVGKELRSMIADPAELEKVLDPIIRAKSVIDAMDKTGASSEGLPQLLKAAELVGAAKDPERLTKLIDGWVKVMQVAGKTVNPEQIFEFVKYSKTASATLSDRFLTTVGPSILQELGGSTTGNDIAMMSKTIATGFSKTHAGMREAARAGLINPDDIDYLSTGEAKGLKPGKEHAVVKDSLFQTDPDKWVYDVLLPHLEAAGVTKQEDQLAWVQRVFTGTAANFIAKTITQRQAYDVHAENYALAKGLAAVGENSRSASVGVDALSKSIENLSANVSAPAMDTIGRGLNTLARGINWLAEAAKDHPAAAMTVGGVGGAAALAGSGWLGVKALNGFGLGTAATSLTGSAAALDAAAVKLGAGGVAGAVEGGGGAAVAGVAAGGLAASIAAVAAPIALAIVAGEKDKGDREAFERTKDSDVAKALPDLGEQTFAQRLLGLLPRRSGDEPAPARGFDTGGWTGFGGRFEPAGIVHKEEFVVRQGPAARHRALLEAMNRGDIRLPGYSSGGLVGGRGGDTFRDYVLARAGAAPAGAVSLSLAADSSSAAALRGVFRDGMIEALRRVRGEGDESGSGGGATGDGDGGGTPNMRYERGSSGRYRGTPGTGQDYEAGPHVSLGRMGAKFAAKAPVILDGLMKKYGLTREQAAGIVGNLAHESAGFTAYHEGGKASAKGGVGWAQWTGPRRRAFEAWTQAHGLDPTSDEASWRYLTEGDPETARAIAAVKREGTVHGASHAWERSFERAGVKAYGSRDHYADEAFGMQPGGAIEEARPAAPPSGAPVEDGRPGHIVGDLRIGSETFRYGSGGRNGAAHIPYGDHEITPDVLGAWGRAHGAMGIDNNRMYDPALGRMRDGIEMHAASTTDLITSGCLGFLKDQYPALKARVRDMIAREGHAYLHIGAGGATITASPTDDAVRRAAAPATAAGAPPAAASVGAHLADLKKSGLITDEQCVTLAMASAGLRKGSGVEGANVHDWRRGAAASDGTLTPGTPVATFLDRRGRLSDRYAGGGVGTPGAGLDHAGVFESYLRGQAGKIVGMKLLEQYKGSGGQHVRDYFFGRGRGEHDGSNYFGIRLASGGVLGGAGNPEVAGPERSTSPVEIRRRSVADAAPVARPVLPAALPGTPASRVRRVRADLEDTADDATEAARRVVREGAASRAVDLADSLDGLGDKAAQTKLGRYMHKGEWCTDFVNGALEKSGVKGTGNAMAESFRNWGHHVDFDKVRRGDVLTMDFGKRQLQHTGFATGAVKDAFGNVGRPDQMKGDIVAVGMTSGNHDDKVIRDYWEPTKDIHDVRRAGPAARREAERAVHPRRPAAAPDAAAPAVVHHDLQAGLQAGLQFDHSAVREAVHHVRELKRELASIGTATVAVRHHGFGDHGGHAPGAVRTALNGQFAHDGRAIG